MIDHICNLRNREIFIFTDKVQSTVNKFQNESYPHRMKQNLRAFLI